MKYYFMYKCCKRCCVLSWPVLINLPTVLPGTKYLKLCFEILFTSHVAVILIFPMSMQSLVFTHDYVIIIRAVKLWQYVMVNLNFKFRVFVHHLIQNHVYVARCCIDFYTLSTCENVPTNS